MNSQDYRLKKQRAKELYAGGTVSTCRLAAAVGVTAATVRNWVKTGNWQPGATNTDIDAEIDRLMSQVLKAKLEWAKDHPADSDARLVSEIRTYRKSREPSKDLVSHLKKFWTLLVEYYYETGQNDLARQLQNSMNGPGGAVEYLLKKAQA